MEAEAVLETPDMIVGMFPVDSHIAEVLFDTGATHSFITASWVELILEQRIHSLLHHG